jgi:uncharacterized protein YdaU (DUF1376 family)
VNFFPFHIGDYTSHTAHLTPIEDICYRRCLDLYYLNEKPLPVDPAEVARLTRLREYKTEVAAVLAEFFALQDDGWHHARCDAEISRAADKRTKATASAGMRWKASEDANAMRTHSERNADAMRRQCYQDQDQSQYQDQSQEKDYGANAPLSSPPKNDGENAEIVAGKTHVPPCPIDEIVNEYHNRLPSLPRVLVRNAKRDGLIRGRWREAFADGKFTDRADGMGLFCEFFDHVAVSRFLTGRADSKPGVPPFCADLEWLMRPTNWAKVVEGKYHR